MKKYNKKQRLAIYKLALAKLVKCIDDDDTYGSGFCWALYHSTHEYMVKNPNTLYIPFHGYDTLKESPFPEVTRHAPNYIGLFWWDTDLSGVTKRIDIITNIIAELSK